MLEVHEIAYNKSGITHVLKLPFTLRYESIDKDTALTKEQSETIFIDMLDWIRKNCEIRMKSIRKKKEPKRRGKK